jgi:glutamate synthase domain-containing protein 2
MMAAAAKALGSLALMDRKDIGRELIPDAPHLVPILPGKRLDLNDPLLTQVPAVEISDHPGVVAQMETIKKRHPGVLVWIRVAADSRAAERVAELALAGAEVLHLAGSPKARGVGDASRTHLKDLVRRCHLKLVEDRLRDAVTLLASGGIALAEHVAKAIIAGADGVMADTSLLLSLECRLCPECNGKAPCPIDLGTLPLAQGAQRMVNLMGAWNNQLLEVLGAMGMREVRRLRGEVGRAMFKEDLDKEIFAPLFARPEGESRRVGE